MEEQPQRKEEITQESIENKRYERIQVQKAEFAMKELARKFGQIRNVEEEYQRQKNSQLREEIFFRARHLISALRTGIEDSLYSPVIKSILNNLSVVIQDLRVREINGKITFSVPLEEVHGLYRQSMNRITEASEMLHREIQGMEESLRDAQK